MTARSDVPDAGSIWVPSVSHVQGSNGTAWRSDLGLLNPAPHRRQFRGCCTHQVASYGNESGPRGEPAGLTDVVGELGYNGSGVLENRLRPSRWW